MSDNENAIDNLRSGNFLLSNLVKEAVKDSVLKAAEFIRESEDPNDLLTAIKVMETATKMVGLSPKETQTNIQINAINGFDFIEIDVEEIKQLTHKEEFEEGEIYA